MESKAGMFLKLTLSNQSHNQSEIFYNLILLSIFGFMCLYITSATNQHRRDVYKNYIKVQIIFDDAYLYTRI